MKDPKKPPKAYRDETFLASSRARPLRMLAEYLEPDGRFRDTRVEDTIVFYGSARIISREDAERRLEEAKSGKGSIEDAERLIGMSRFYDAARELSKRLTQWSKGLTESDRRFVICSGGGPGIMEAANRGASEAKGVNIGLGISLPHEEGANQYVSRELIFQFHYFFMRKFWFTYMAKAVIVMPGGFGTLDELFETLTLVQTGRVKKKMAIVLFGQDYWSKVLNLEALVEFGTISPTDLDLFIITDSIDEAFDYVTRELEHYGLDQPGPHL
jgi:uncharacterized protein (TIGR00730 family)